MYEPESRLEVAVRCYVEFCEGQAITPLTVNLLTLQLIKNW